MQTVLTMSKPFENAVAKVVDKKETDPPQYYCKWYARDYSVKYTWVTREDMQTESGRKGEQTSSTRAQHIC